MDIMQTLANVFECQLEQIPSVGNAMFLASIYSLLHNCWQPWYRGVQRVVRNSPFDELA